MESSSTLSTYSRCARILALGSFCSFALLASDDEATVPRTTRAVRETTSPPPGYYSPTAGPQAFAAVVPHLPLHESVPFKMGATRPSPHSSSHSSSGSRSPANPHGVMGMVEHTQQQTAHYYSPPMKAGIPQQEGVDPFTLPAATSSSRPSSAPMRSGPELPFWKILARALAEQRVVEGYDFHPLLGKLSENPACIQDCRLWATLAGIPLLFAGNTSTQGIFEDCGLGFLRNIGFISEDSEQYASHLRNLWSRRDLGARVGWELPVLKDTFLEVKNRIKVTAGKKSGKTSPDPECTAELVLSKTDVSNGKINILIDALLTIIDSRISDREALQRAAQAASESPVYLGRQSTDEFLENGGGLSGLPEVKSPQRPSGGGLRLTDDSGGGLAKQRSASVPTEGRKTKKPRARLSALGSSLDPDSGGGLQPSDDPSGGELRQQAERSGSSSSSSSTEGDDSGGGLARQTNNSGGGLAKQRDGASDGGLRQIPDSGGGLARQPNDSGGGL